MTIYESIGSRLAHELRMENEKRKIMQDIIVDEVGSDCQRTI